MQSMHDPRQVHSRWLQDVWVYAPCSFSRCLYHACEGYSLPLADACSWMLMARSTAVWRAVLGSNHLLHVHYRVLSCIAMHGVCKVGD
jgi:hypothetical protein